MADASYTTTRRAVITGAAAALAPIPAAAAGEAKGSLPGDFALRCQAWHAAHAASEAAFEETEEKIEALGDRPAVPAILTENLSAQDGTIHEPPESPIYFVDRLWKASDLAAIIEKGGFSYATNTVNADRIITEFKVRPLADDAMDKVREMHQIALDYEGASRRFMDACGAIESVANRQYNDVFDAGMDLLTTPASSLAELSLKVAIAKRLLLFDNRPRDSEPSPEEAASLAILADIERLANQDRIAHGSL